METRGQKFLSLGRPDPRADRATLEQIQRRTPRVAGHVELHHFSAGVSLTPVAPLQEPRFTQPLHPLGLKSTGNVANTNAYLQPAYALDGHIENKGFASGGFELRDIYINGRNSVWEVPPPPLALAAPKQYTYLTWNTNELGKTTTNYNVVSYSAEQVTNYHFPPDADGTGGNNGEYFLEIFRTDLENEDWHKRLERKWGGHPPWLRDSLWAGIHQETNANTDPHIARPFIGFEQDLNRYLYRAHTNGHGHNVYEYTSNIFHQFCARNIGTGSSNTANVYTGNTTPECAEFNIIKERDSDPQVSVLQSTNEDPIEIRGNNNDVTITLRHSNGVAAVSMVFRDGLIIAPTADTDVIIN